ncbi:hypothetical protein AL532_13000 [Pseudomonas monteilii]|uniref:Uncharacterized protein n=1 Tax=Pseudomonas monteilii TaxID=76759 RepID=A0A7X3F116_9PSED|nr:hypothetical protein AL532_13000 [Pseudomonas monteilii]MVF49134.1 hypothetical protein [Pseudomonas monteilii]
MRAFLLALPALSRVNPLPQVLHCSAERCVPCGSGFTRERASTGNTGIPGKKRGADQAPHKP